jgi:hypothetical protein
MATPAPTPANYRVIELAELEGHSKVIWLFDQNRVEFQSIDLAASGFTDLKGVVCFNSTLKHPLLPELEEGWEQFGLMQSREAHIPIEGAKQLAYSIGVRWALAFRWQGFNQPYTALIEAQNKLKPTKLSLAPQLIVPLIFISRMARYPGLALGDDQAFKRFLPLFYQTVEKLYPLVSELYFLWMSGSSQSAARYRADLVTPEDSPAGKVPLNRHTLRVLRILVGQPRLDQLKQTERPEPMIIRLLDETSTKLWQRPVAKGASSNCSGPTPCTCGTLRCRG